MNWFYKKKAVRITNFQSRNSHTSPLFKQNFISKFQDKICLENILFVSKLLNNLTTSVFSTWFSFSSDQHNYETSSSTQCNLAKLFYKTNRYGKYSITVSTVESWNKIQKQLKDMLLKSMCRRESENMESWGSLKFLETSTKWKLFVGGTILPNFSVKICTVPKISQIKECTNWRPRIYWP